MMIYESFQINEEIKKNLPFVFETVRAYFPAYLKNEDIFHEWNFATNLPFRILKS